MNKNVPFGILITWLLLVASSIDISAQQNRQAPPKAPERKTPIDSLSSIETKMQSAHQKMRNGDREALKLQEDALVQLRQLLDGLDRRPQGSSGSQATLNQSASNPPSQTNAQGTGSATQAATNSDDIDSAPATLDTPVSQQDLVERSWGNLPPQVRERLQSSGSEKFLPQYQDQIEAYFKRLSGPNSNPE